MAGVGGAANSILERRLMSMHNMRRESEDDGDAVGTPNVPVRFTILASQLYFVSTQL